MRSLLSLYHSRSGFLLPAGIFAGATRSAVCSGHRTHSRCRGVPFRLCRCVFFASARFFLRCWYRFPLSRLPRKSSSRLSVVFLSDSLPGSYSDMPVRHLEQLYGLLLVGLAGAVLMVTELVFVEYI